MEQQDYLKRQIDQLGRVLGKILTDFIGLKNKGQINNGIELARQTLKSELAIDIYELIEIQKDEFVNTLQSKMKFTNDTFNLLAEILLLLAENSPDKKKSLYEKCLCIYEFLEKEENVYSLDRQWKIERLRNVL